MTAEWPEMVLNLEDFLKGLRMECMEKTVDSEHFGNRLMDYASSTLIVRVVLDRGRWSIELGEVNRPATWYDMGLLKALLSNNAPSLSSLSLEDQVSFLKANWPSVAVLFEPNRREDTFTALVRLGDERARKLLPGLF